MINSVMFHNFRGLKDMHLSELKRITLISGKNNTGKSSILEGIFLYLDHMAPESFVKLNRFRGLPLSLDAETVWEPMFYQLDTKEPIRMGMELNGEISSLEYSRDDSFVPVEAGGIPQDVFHQFVSSAKSSFTLKFRFEKGDYWEEGHFIAGANGMLRNNLDTSAEGNQILDMPFTQFINSAILGNDPQIIEWFGRLELTGKKQEIIDILKLIEEDICDISTIAYNGSVQLYAKVGQQLMPLKLAGDGMGKLLFIILSIAANKNSVILIDEIEAGFHYSMFPMLWEAVACAAMKYNCQIIATTHSYECIDGAVEGIEEAKLMEEFCYYRVEREEHENRAFRYSGELVRSAINSNMEVR